MQVGWNKEVHVRQYFAPVYVSEEPITKGFGWSQIFSNFGLGFGCLILLLKIFTQAKGLDKMVFFPLVDHKSFEMAFILSLKSSYNRDSPKSDPIILKRKISSY